MKCFFSILMLIMTIFCPLYAQTTQQTTPQTTQTVAVRGCNVLLMQFGWQDGQAISLKDLQNILKTMRLPDDYTLTPQSGIEAIANLNEQETPSLVFHCTDDQQLAQNTIVRFYFSYLLPDNSTANTPEFIVTRTTQTIAEPAKTVTQ